MKQSILRFLLFALILSVKTGLFAYDFVIGDFIYTITSVEDKTVELTLMNKTKDYARIEIPSHVEHDNISYAVTSIGNYAFCGQHFLSLTLGNNVKYIGNGAFSDISELKSLEIPNSVISLGNYAFEDCISLSSVSLGDNLQIIGEGAFKNCKSLTSVYMTNSIIEVGASAFEGCVAMTNLKLSESLEKISYRTFYGCKRITNITIPNSVTIIEEEAFCNCFYTEKLTLGEAIKRIDTNAFCNLGKIKGIIEFPSSLEIIDHLSFASCGAKGYIFKSSTPPKLGLYCFGNTANVDHVLFVPKTFLQDYLDSWRYPRKASDKTLYSDTSLEGVIRYWGYVDYAYIVTYNTYDDILNGGIKEKPDNDENDGIEGKKAEVIKAYDEGIELYNTYLSFVEREHTIINEFSQYYDDITKYHQDCALLIKDLKDKLNELSFDEETRNKYISTLNDYDEKNKNIYKDCYPSEIKNFEPILIAKDLEFEEFRKLLEQYKADVGSAFTVEELDAIKAKVVVANKEQKGSLDSFLESYNRDTIEKELNTIKGRYDELTKLLGLIKAFKDELVGVDNKTDDVTDIISDGVAEAVDLGLSVRWASCNVGANKPEGYGDLYAWGELLPKENYTKSTYKFYNKGYTKYGSVDNKYQLDLDDDVARQRWGVNWRMPTYKELKELYDKCTFVETNLNGVTVNKVTGPNGNFIYFPYSGNYTDENIYFREKVGSFWCSTLEDDNNGKDLDFLYGKPSINDELRYHGQSVRPVYVGGTSSIRVVTDNKDTDDIYHNLQGQRVIHPKNGIYIKNGKKVLIK